jgi:hypothetical protein
MASWREYSLLASTVISAVGTFQALASLPRAMKQTNSAADRANMTLGVVGGVIGTAMSFDYWKRTHDERIRTANQPLCYPTRPGAVKLGHIVAY